MPRFVADRVRVHLRGPERPEEPEWVLSGKITASHVLAAMGLGTLAGQAIRVSLPWNAQESDVAAFAAAYQRMADRLRTALAPRAA